MERVVGAVLSPRSITKGFERGAPFEDETRSFALNVNAATFARNAATRQRAPNPFSAHIPPHGEALAAPGLMSKSASIRGGEPRTTHRPSSATSI